MHAHRSMEDVMLHPAPVLPDLKRSGLMRLRYLPHSGSLTPLNEEYDADDEYRRSALKARSTLAAAYLRGHLGARFGYFTKQEHDVPYLLLGQESSLGTAPTDLADLLDRCHFATLEGTKALVPVLLEESGWRPQFGWLALRQPHPSDHRALYGYLRPSLSWLSMRTSSEAELAQVRGMEEARCFKPLNEIVEDALTARHF